MLTIKYTYINCSVVYKYKLNNYKKKKKKKKEKKNKI